MARHLYYPILNYQYAKLVALIIVSIMLDNTYTFLDNVLVVSGNKGSFATSVYEYHGKYSRTYRREIMK